VLAVDNWAKSLDKGVQRDIAIFDFRTAFDSVPHRHLFPKLHSYGIRGNTLQWISSFLTSRKQRVTLNGSYLPWLPVTSGVPQGTILGSLLFLIYINDITTNINSEICLFADDCILYRTITSLSDCKLLQVDLNTMHEWQMQFNSKKCHILTLPSGKINLHHLINLSGDILLNFDSYPYLGVTVSSDLKWYNHIASITNKAARTLNFVRRNIYNCPSKTKALAYVSLVRPHLEYAAIAWDPHLNRDILQLEMIQRSAARFVYRDYHRSTSKNTQNMHFSTVQPSFFDITPIVST
jgi:ribonucleases P/MRP protein subunit RPP40